MTIKVSTNSLSSFIPFSAFCILRLPSKVKGFVTTATVRIPFSLQAFAITEIAPVPVPPPIPAVINAICAPSIYSQISL